MRRVVLLITAIGVALLLVSGVALAAPVGMLKQYKVPTAGSSPEHITRASDGNFWFTESFVNNQNATPHKVGRITPAGQVTEFDVCDFCFPTDIVQGSDGILYFTKNDASLGRITTEGTVLADIPAAFSPNGNGLDAHGDDIWFADFNNHSVWRYDIPNDAFTEFPAPNTVPLDVAVAADGIVWFTDGNGQIGKLDPTTGIVTEIDVEGFPREINIASDGAVWFTERFSQAVGRINPVPDPDSDDVNLFPAEGGPEDIAPAGPDGSMWFTRSTGGTIARISPDGLITATSKAVRGSEPTGITVAPNGDPWFTMLSADKIATLQLR